MGQVLKDRNGCRIGEIKNSGNKEIIVDRNGCKLGSYDGKNTYDRNGCKVGEGDLLSKLIK